MSNKSSGFSLIELMIAMVIGLVVIGSVLSFTLSSLNSNTEYVQSARLSQELRGSMDFVTRELRRSGYDQAVSTYTARSTLDALVISPFSRILITKDLDANGTADDACTIYAYDRTDNGVGAAGVVDLDNAEIRGLRLAKRTVDGLTVGVLEMAQSDTALTPSCSGNAPNYVNYPPTCSSSGWCALSDPRVINITSFELDDSNYIIEPSTATAAPMTIREIGVEMQAQLRQSQDGTVTRAMRANIKVRADCLEASADCAKAPSGS